MQDPEDRSSANVRIASFKLCSRLVYEHMSAYKGGFALASVCMLMVSATTAAQAKLIEPLIDKIFLQHDKALLYQISGAVLAVSLVKGACSFVSTYLSRFLGLSVTVDIQKRLFAHLIRHDHAFVTDESSGKLVSRFTNDVQALRTAVSGVIVGMVKEGFTFLALVCVMVYQSPLFSFIAMVCVPAAIAPVLKLGRRMRKESYATQTELGAYTQRLSETIYNISAVQSCRAEAYEISRADATLDRLRECYRRTSRIQAGVAPVMETLGGVSVAVVVLYGGLMVADGDTTPGKFTSFLTAVILAYRPLKTISGLNSLLQEGMAAASRVYQLLDSKPTITTPAIPKSLPPPPKGELAGSVSHVAFKDVRFRYPKSNMDALNDLHFTVEVGQMVALVGASGAGKSTVMKLLNRIYDPDHGSVAMCGIDVRELALDDVRGAVAYVPQRPLLFEGTVADNIAYACRDASREAIEDAAERAAAAEFIRELPHGYDTSIGEYGDRLSGGQRQRLALARAILQNAPILALDEATSALDNVSERYIRDALRAEAGKRTVILIAHRLIMAMAADRVLVFDKGKIVEEGTHEELAAAGGVYAALAEEMKRNED